MPVTSSVTADDAGKFIQDALIDRTELMHKLPQFAEKVKLPSGNAKTANFVQYNRTDVPVDKLTEGTTPTETPFTITTKSITTDQWGLYIALTDVIEVTTKHPVLNEALDLVADAIARCQDYNIAEVLNAGTNVQYWDGTRANRGAITASDTFKAAVINKARADLNDKAVPGRAGDMFIAVIGPQLEADIINEATAVGGFTAAHQTNAEGVSKLERGVVGDWLGVRFVRSNFMPKFTRIATVAAPTPGAGGSLSGTVHFKVTRKSLTRGFEEDIQVAGSQAMGGDTRLPFVAPSTAGYVYNIYAGSAAGDANLFLAKENLAASATYNLDTLPTSGQNPPATPAASVTVHPMYIFGAKALDNVEIDELNMQGSITPKGPSDSDPLQQRRKVGAKYMSKAGIRDQDRVKRVELASAF